MGEGFRRRYLLLAGGNREPSLVSNSELEIYLIRVLIFILQVGVCFHTTSSAERPQRLWIDGTKDV